MSDTPAPVDLSGAQSADATEAERLAAAIVDAIDHHTSRRPESDRVRLLGDLKGLLDEHPGTAAAAAAFDEKKDTWTDLVGAIHARLVEKPGDSAGPAVGQEFAIRLCDQLHWPRPFSLAFHDELRTIETLRGLRKVGPTAPPAGGWSGNLERAHASHLVGLAFSGGGIRSATFNLGVLQGLESLKMLDRFDYLSTVSGGGYIGSWLVSWIRREGRSTVSAGLLPNVAQKFQPTLAKPIAFLRQFSNYLTPRLGLFSADSWTLVAVYFRNVLLNLTTLVCGFAAVLLIPRLFFLDAFHHNSRFVDGIKIVVGVLLIFLALWIVVNNLRKVTAHRWPDDDDPQSRRMQLYTRQGIIQGLAVAPLLIACYLFTKPLWRLARASSETPWTMRWWWGWCLGFGALAAVSSFIVQVGGGFLECYADRRAKWKWIRWPEVFVFALISGAAAAGLLRLLFEAALTLHRFGYKGRIDFWVFGPPALLATIGLTTIVGIGLMGLDFPDSGREWFSRFGAWLAIYAIVWFALFGAVVYGPYGVAAVVHYSQSGALPVTLVAGWIATTISSVLAAKSPSTGSGEDGSRRSRLLEIVAHLGPPVFAIGFVILVGLAVDLLLAKPHFGDKGIAAYTDDYGWNHFAFIKETSFCPHTWAEFADWPFGFVWPLFIALVFVTLLLSWRVDINEFSMHHFYKNRLVRCFLGASRSNRRPNLFTGFDEYDDELLATFQPNPLPREGKVDRANGEVDEKPYVGPYPIINAALNYTAGAQLAWQERKAASFVFTPLFCGFEPAPESGPRRRRGITIASKLRTFGFRKTREYAYQPHGMHIGTAVAISGAAVSPNQGYHTSSALAFLMTVFDVRLGWWLGNPRSDEKSAKSSPLLGLMYTVKELFGLSDDRSGFVSISDGGHFENLGIYELVRRRCSVIVACDAEQDEGLTFNGLAGAVRKCRTDFDVEIDIDPSRVQRAVDTKRSRTHCVVGTIRYPEARDNPGLLIYLKSSLTGEEPADVLEYAASHRGFPHESTGDQWFDESQFESYRRLGLHVATTTFKPAIDLYATMKGTPIEFADEFRAAERMWYPPSAAIEAYATKHTRTYSELLDKLRSDEQLTFLDRQLFPDSKLPQVTPTPENRREAFYFCTALIQLLEDIWTDFKLEDELQRRSPHVEGWISLYRGWIAGSPTLQATWEGVQSTYGTRFRAFWKQLEEMGP